MLTERYCTPQNSTQWASDFADDMVTVQNHTSSHGIDICYETSVTHKCFYHYDRCNSDNGTSQPIIIATAASFTTMTISSAGHITVTGLMMAVAAFLCSILFLICGRGDFNKYLRTYARQNTDPCNLPVFSS